MMRVGNAVRAVMRRRDGRLTTYADRYRIAAAMSVMPLSLPRILATFGSDKQRAGEHSYGESYHRLFAPLRYRRLKILEIGLLSGASLLAWRAFFPRAMTAGLDIEDKPGLAGDRTRIYQGDQGSAADLQRLCDAEAPFDVVIDDGSHLSRHQIFSFTTLFAHLRDGGLYVIEDVQTSFWSGVVNGFPWDGAPIAEAGFADTCYGWFLDLAKYINHAEFQTLAGTDPRKLELGRAIRRIGFEHNVITVEKGDNSAPSNLIRPAPG